jgi:methylated-DNA-[protein]-cysteine S-methyltransferase
MLRYTVFRTKWGHFGLAGRDDAVSRTCLPIPQRHAVERALLRDLTDADEDIRSDKTFLRAVQERIRAYFEGEPVDFCTDPPVDLNSTTPFGRQVLRACRKIGLGEQTTYRALAIRIGRAGAARAVGSVMAANPTPLIIPCHRVLRTDGGLGGFSAAGGTATKQQMLDHEQALLIAARA